MAVIREHLASKGVGLHKRLAAGAAVVGNFNVAELVLEFGSEERKERHLEDLIEGETTAAFGLSEPEHGSDATHMDTTAEKAGDEWVINGAKRWNSGMHTADYDVIFARTDGEDGDHEGITAFWVPTDADGVDVEYFHWTFNMPTDHAEVTLDDVRVPDDAILGEEGKGAPAGVVLRPRGPHQAGRLERRGRPVLYRRGGRVREGPPHLGRTAREATGDPVPASPTCTRRPSWFETWCTRRRGNSTRAVNRVSATRSRWRTTAANLLACDAADRAMQVHGGQGYTRHKPFEHVYRHHRRYRITEGSEEIQKRNVAGHLFDYLG
nr:acyl-CoA dehydrogenase [Natrinema saccharevitans]